MGFAFLDGLQSDLRLELGIVLFLIPIMSAKMVKI